MTIDPLRILAAISESPLAIVVQRLGPPRPRGRGRPWGCALRYRVLVVCVALRTNLTIRELAAVSRISKSSVHRILAVLVPALAALASDGTRTPDRRRTWIVDGTLIPTRDHTTAARSKNYRWSCNAQLLVCHRDLRVVATTAGGPGNRNDPMHYRGSVIERLAREHGRVLADGGYRGVAELVTPRFRRNRIVRDYRWRRHRNRRARVEHTIARLKNWRVLRDHRRRGRHLAHTVATVAFLHNLQVEMRDNA
jgi:hypothetical protein